MFINNKILSTSTKKYFSIVLFNMNAKEFMKASLWMDLITNFILHSLCYYSNKKSSNLSIYYFGFLGRILGERINLLHYNKYKISITYNYPVYWTVVLLGLGLCLSPLINVQITQEVIPILDIILVPIAIICYIQIMKIDNYKLIYKKINTKVAALNSNQAKEYSRQAMIEIKEKDKKIDERKFKK